MRVLSDANRAAAQEIIRRYPVNRSALGPLLHLVQSQEGHITDAAIEEVAELVGITAAEAVGFCSFYEMFKREKNARFQINICHGISCSLKGSTELIDHAQKTLGIPLGSMTEDGLFGLAAVECIAACSEAPCLQTNYRYEYQVDAPAFEELVSQLKEGQLDKKVPSHGVLARTVQKIPEDKAAGAVLPSDKTPPKWMSDKPVLTPAASSAAAAKDSPDEPILTSHLRESNSHRLETYLKLGGYGGLKQALAMPPEQVHNEIKNASLLGRGGAGFPAGVKWGFCPPDVWPRYLVVNGDESEPGTYKDRMLAEEDPHQLIEGCLIACYAVGLGQCFLYLRGEMALGAERLGQALNEAYEAGLAGKNILGTDFSVDIVLHSGAGAYIVGEETALIESLEGNRGMPRLKPPRFPAADGLYGQPTVVNNVETLSNLGWILKNGAEAFVARGGEVSAGTRLFTVSGHIQNPGIFEVPFGTTTFRQLIFDYAGGLNEGRSLKAFIPGGASSPWFTDQHLDMPMEKSTVDEAGSMLGSGAVVVMDDTTDIVLVCHNLVRFFAHESCGKCTPCREGTAWMEQILSRIIAKRGRPQDLEILLDVCQNISPGLSWPPKMTTICPLGPSAVAVVVSALNLFRSEFEAYIDQAPKSLRELEVRPAEAVKL